MKSLHLDTFPLELPLTFLSDLRGDRRRPRNYFRLRYQITVLTQCCKELSASANIALGKSLRWYVASRTALLRIQWHWSRMQLMGSSRRGKSLNLYRAVSPQAKPPHCHESCRSDFWLAVLSYCVHYMSRMFIKSSNRFKT